MNNFPFFQHRVIRLIFDQKEKVDRSMVENLAKVMVKKLELKVVKETEYEFKNKGLTKIFILSQSHMIFHTWPEKGAIHIDLITCSRSTNMERLRNIFDDFPIKKVEVTELNY